MKHGFELFVGRSLHLYYFTQVTNTKDVLDEVRTQGLEIAFISPTLLTMRAAQVVDEFQVLAAAQRALHEEANGSMKTKNVHSELLYCLSGRQNVSESIRKFGMDLSQDHFLVAIFDADDAQISRLRELVKGTESDLADFKKHTALPQVLQHYKVSPAEQTLDDILGSVVSRIATRGC